MEQTDELLAAVQDVTSVAAELREVKRRAEQYGQATTRLQEVGASLSSLAGAVSSMQSRFQSLLSKASSVVSEIEQARITSEVAAKSVPDIVARIEATDVSKSVREFSHSLELVDSRIAAQLAAIENMQTVLSHERDAQKQMFEAITSRSERVAATIESVATDVTFLRTASDKRVDQFGVLLNLTKEIHSSLAGYTETAAATKVSSDKAASASAVFGHKGLQAILELNKKMETVQSTLEAHDKLLTAIKGKKGFHF